MPDAGDSSVLFSLREIMELERERVEAEKDAARAAEAEATQDRLEIERDRKEQTERSRLREQQREQETRDEEERVRTEREAALLRVRLEVEAKARAEQERLSLEHQRALRRLDLEARRSVVVRGLVALLVLEAAGAAAGYAMIVAPALSDAHAREVHARRIADERTEENVDLLHRLLEVEATRAPVVRAPQPQVPVAPSLVSEATVEDVRRESRARWRERAPRPTEGEHALEGIDSDSDDPLQGLFDAPNAKEKP